MRRSLMGCPPIVRAAATTMIGVTIAVASANHQSEPSRDPRDGMFHHRAPAHVLKLGLDPAALVRDPGGPVALQPSATGDVDHDQRDGDDHE
jgi:hypothetical protein